MWLILIVMIMSLTMHTAICWNISVRTNLMCYVMSFAVYILMVRHCMILMSDLMAKSSSMVMEWMHIIDGPCLSCGRSCIVEVF